MDDTFTIEKLILNLPRSTIQGGIPNSIYPIADLYDGRLTHHYTTYHTMVWKNL
jgi:hypothetical protein